MRVFWVVAFAAATLSAQHANVMSPVRSMPAPVNAHRFGNILFPGGVPQSHPSRLGRTVAGVPHPGGITGHRPGWGNGSRPRTIVVPYAVPVWSGGYYGNPYMQEQQPITVVVPQQPAPSVIINHNYSPGATPNTASRESSVPETSVRVYEGGSARREPASEPASAAAPAPASVRDDRPTIYLIALKDSTVRQAIGYWLRSTTLHYVTPQGSINHVSLDLVDRETSEQLNSERKLDFDIKTAVN